MLIPRRLIIKEILKNREICHYASKNLRVTSWYRNVYIERDGYQKCVTLPKSKLEMGGWSRLVRRALRLDKCNVVPAGKDMSDLVIVRQGMVYHYDGNKDRLTPVLKLRNCRNVLHQSIARVGEDDLFLGEYGSNPRREPVPIYRSRNGGQSWENIFTFKGGSIKHVHGCYWDKYTEKLWTLTGDFKGECHMLISDLEFRNTHFLGDGTQMWRACNVFFERDRVVWIMDSQLEDSHVVIFNRHTCKAEMGQTFPGPVWYIKRLEDGYYLAATACEIGPGVHDNYAHIMYSYDLKEWQEIARYQHDGLPKRWFKFGVIGFADGAQFSDDFVFFGEALKGVDGRLFRCRITHNES